MSKTSSNSQKGKQVQPAEQPQPPAQRLAPPKTPFDEKPPCEVSESTQDEINEITRNAPAGPIRRTTPIEQAIEQDKATPTTMKVKPDTKAQLEELKSVFKLPDLDAVVGRLIDTLPKRLSTETEVHLIMPASKYRWLMAHQDTCDCRTCLNDAKV